MYNDFGHDIWLWKMQLRKEFDPFVDTHITYDEPFHLAK